MSYCQVFDNDLILDSYVSRVAAPRKLFVDDRLERVDNQQIQINAAASATNDEKRSDSLS